jgi:serine/threonine protein kinase
MPRTSSPLQLPSSVLFSSSTIVKPQYHIFQSHSAVEVTLLNLKMDIDLSSLRMELPLQEQSPKEPEFDKDGLEHDNAKCAKSERAAQEQKPTDFVALVSLALSFDIPWIHLEPSTGVQPSAYSKATFNAHFSYCLGEGAFSFVEMHALRNRHMLNGKIYRPGHLVALKRYPVSMDARDDQTHIQSECYDFIRNELRVATQLGSSPQENICNLLFLGWEDHTPVPVLGLEFAHYGTAKDLLVSPEFETIPHLGLQIVVDITLGLKALHSAGIVHGDIKPGNILVFRHNDRTTVAKLTDFSSSIFMSDVEKHGWRPVGGTAVWRAPECSSTNEYDLLKTDVYSYGLTAHAILARGPSEETVWSSTASRLGDCFLARAPVQDVHEFVTAIKCAADDSALHLATSWAKDFLDEPDLFDFVEWLLQGTVRTKPEDRLTLPELVPKILNQMKDVGVEISRNNA